MNVQAGDGARASVKVLIRAPDCEVDVPVVKLHGNVSDCMGEVPTADTTLIICATRKPHSLENNIQLKEITEADEKV